MRYKEGCDEYHKEKHKWHSCLQEKWEPQTSTNEESSCKNKCKLLFCLYIRNFGTIWSLNTRSILYSSSLLTLLSSDKFSKTAARQSDEGESEEMYSLTFLLFQAVFACTAVWMLISWRKNFGKIELILSRPPTLTLSITPEFRMLCINLGGEWKLIANALDSLCGECKAQLVGNIKS